MGLLQVSAIDKRGELSTIYTNEQFADGWTHILKGNFFGAVNTSDFIFYNGEFQEGFGSAELYTITDTGKLELVKEISAIDTGWRPYSQEGDSDWDNRYYLRWSHMLTGAFLRNPKYSKYNSLCFYEGATGNLEIYGSLGNGDFQLVKKTSGEKNKALRSPYAIPAAEQFYKPWQKLVSSHFGYGNQWGSVLCYSDSSASLSPERQSCFQMLSTDGEGTLKMLSLDYEAISPVTYIVAGNFSGDVGAEFIAYSAYDGSARFFNFDHRRHGYVVFPERGIAGYTVNQYKEIKPGGWLKNWDMLIPAKFSDYSKYVDLVFYDRSRGNVGFYANKGNAQFEYINHNDSLRKTWDYISGIWFKGQRCLLFYDSQNKSENYYKPFRYKFKVVTDPETDVWTRANLEMILSDVERFYRKYSIYLEWEFFQLTGIKSAPIYKGFDLPGPYTSQPLFLVDNFSDCSSCLTKGFYRAGLLKVGFRGTSEHPAASLWVTIAHEIGHYFGLSHTSNQQVYKQMNLMNEQGPINFTVSEVFLSPEQVIKIKTQ